MKDFSQWFVFNVNPYPWKVPPFQPGRKGNRLFVTAGRDQGLHSYKEAIKEQLLAMDYTKIDGPVELSMWFFRNVPSYTTQRGRTANKHDADTTNLQKAAEDALQGILFDNDRDVVRVTSHRVEQSPQTVGLLVVRVRPDDNSFPVFPEDVQFEISNIRSPVALPDNRNFYTNPEDVPF